MMFHASPQRKKVPVTATDTFSQSSTILNKLPTREPDSLLARTYEARKEIGLGKK